MSKPITIRGVLDEWAEFPVNPQTRTEFHNDLLRLVREHRAIDGLPPLPDYPHTRFVLDSVGEKPPVFNHPGISNTRTFLRVAGVVRQWEVKLIRGITPVKPADPIPERVERALHSALGCCDPTGAECDGSLVRRVWEESK